MYRHYNVVLFNTNHVCGKNTGRERNKKVTKLLELPSCKAYLLV